MFKIFRKLSAERINYEDRSPFFHQHHKAYLFCKRFIKNKNVLSVGAGSGYGEFELSELSKKIIAIEPDKYAVLQAHRDFKRSNLKFINTSIEDFSSSAQFDTIIALQLIEHLNSHYSFLEKITSLLKPDGIVILSTPNAQTSSYNENPYHYREFESTELKKVLLKFFKRVIIYGLFGDRLVNIYETERRRQVLHIYKLDFLNLRRLLPRSFRQLLFDLFSFFRKKFKAKRYYDISEKNYTIKKNRLQNAIDLIAICSLPRD